MTVPLAEGVRRSLGDAIFTRVAGSDGDRARDRIHGTPGARWFAPDSAIARVHGDASMFVGGLRAVMVQTLHPVAMRAVAEHSGYRGDMWGRLARTSTFLAVTTFGTERHAAQAIDAVRTIHDRVTGTMPDGTPYVASDPDLLRWVHVAEVSSFLVAHQRYGARPLDRLGRDEYVAQAATIARRLGATDVPTTEAALWRSVEEFRPDLRVTPEAHEAVQFLLRHPELPWAARPAYHAIAAGAIGLMPRWARRELGLVDSPLVDRLVAVPLGGVMTRGIRWAMAARPAPTAR